jgi:hypothetical protein
LLTAANLQLEAEQVFKPKDKADRTYREALGIQPDNPRALKDMSQIADEMRQQQRIDTLLAEAEQDLEQGRLTDPKGDNAYEAFIAVLAIAPTAAWPSLTSVSPSPSNKG